MSLLNNTKELTIDCGCYNIAHKLYFSANDEELYITHFLETGPFLRRFIIGIKYIFGFKCRYGHFNETVLLPEQIKELKDFLNTL